MPNITTWHVVAGIGMLFISRYISVITRIIIRYTYPRELHVAYVLQSPSLTIGIDCIYNRDWLRGMLAVKFNSNEVARTRLR